MTIFRYKKNELLYTITREGARGGYSYKAHPCQHDVEVGIMFTSHAKYRNFKSDMKLDDFEAVSFC